MVTSRFLTRVKWGSFEQLLYQSVLLGHELLLWRHVSTVTYGIIGTVFALTYLSGALLNFGFDTSIAPFFSQASKEKRAAFRLFFIPLLFQVLLVTVLPLLGYAMLQNSLYIIEKVALIGYGNLIVCWLLTITESTKRSLRTFLHCAFLNKKTALIETATILSFATLVWGGYFVTGHLSLSSILISLFASSLMSTTILLVLWSLWYKNLPNDTENKKQTSFKRVIWSRFFGYLHQINRQIFSSNTVIPSVALLFGAGEAGALTLLSSIGYFIRVIQKTLNLSQEATISEGKEFSLEKKQELFAQTAGISYYALNLTVLILIFITPLILYFSGIHLPSKLVLLYFLFLFSENFFSIYEFFFITEEKIHLFLLCNSLMLASIVLIMNYIFSFSPTLALTLIIAIRLIGFMGLRSFSLHRWGIKPHLSSSLVYLSYPLITSLSLIYALI